MNKLLNEMQYNHHIVPASPTDSHTHNSTAFEGTSFL